MSLRRTNPDTGTAGGDDPLQSLLGYTGLVRNVDHSHRTVRTAATLKETWAEELERKKKEDDEWMRTRGRVSSEPYYASLREEERLKREERNRQEEQVHREREEKLLRLEVEFRKAGTNEIQSIVDNALREDEDIMERWAAGARDEPRVEMRGFIQRGAASIVADEWATSMHGLYWKLNNEANELWTRIFDDPRDKKHTPFPSAEEERNRRPNEHAEIRWRFMLLDQNLDDWAKMLCQDFHPGYPETWKKIIIKDNGFTIHGHTTAENVALRRKSGPRPKWLEEKFRKEGIDKIQSMVDDVNRVDAEKWAAWAAGESQAPSMSQAWETSMCGIYEDLNNEATQLYARIFDRWAPPDRYYISTGDRLSLNRTQEPPSPEEQLKLNKEYLGIRWRFMLLDQNIDDWAKMLCPVDTDPKIRQEIVIEDKGFTKNGDTTIASLEARGKDALRNWVPPKFKLLLQAARDAK